MFGFGRKTDERKERNLGPLISFLILGSAAAAIPYLLVRRQLVATRADLKKANHRADTAIRANAKTRDNLVATEMAVKEQSKMMVALKQDMSNWAKNASEGRKELTRIRELVQALNAKVGGVKAGVKDGVGKVGKDLQRIQQSMEALKMRQEERIKREDAQHEKCEQDIAYVAVAIGHIGRALADVAAFMQEVEIRQGYPPSKDDGRGIERMRQVAKKLQDLPSTRSKPKQHRSQD